MINQAAADAVYRKVGWRIVPFLILAYMAAYLDRSNLGFAKLQAAHDLGFSEAVYGLGAGLFYLGYSLFGLPSNLVLNRIGARSTMAAIMILWGLAAAGFALIATAGQFYSLRFLLGCAEAGLFPGAMLYLTYWIPSARRARFTALFMSAMALSGLIGGPLSGWIMSSADGLGGWHGWRWMFLLEAMPPLVLGAVTHLWLVDRPGAAKWLSDDEKALIEADMAADRATAPPLAASPGAVLIAPWFYALCGMAVALTAGVGGIAFWLPTILRQAGIKAVWQVGLLSALPYLAAVVAQQWMARRSDRRQERRLHAALSALVAGGAWCLMPTQSAHPVASLLLLSLVCAGTFAATGPFWSMPPGFMSGPAAASGIALLTTFGGLGAFVSPIFVGWITTRTGDLDMGEYFYGAMLILAAVFLAIGARRTGEALKV